MSKKALAVWIGAGLLALAAAILVRPRLAPLFPDSWTLNRDEAEAIGLEKVKVLGSLPERPYVIVDRASDEVIDYRLHELLRSGNTAADLRQSRIYKSRFGWRVTVYDPEEASGRWSHRVRLTPDGEVMRLQRLWQDEEGSGTMEAEAARRQADAFLESLGFDLDHYQSPELRSRELDTRVDTTVRYVDREALFGTRMPYGLEVTFAGPELAGVRPFFDDPDSELIESRFQSFGLLQQAWIFLPILLLPFVAVPFVRRYHAGEIGVSRGLHIAGVVVACGLLTILFSARGIAAGWNFGILTKPQTTMVIVFQFTIVFFLPMAAMAFLSWSVGESLCRERSGHRLAGLDAFFRGQWANATFARSVLQGLVAGLGVGTLAWVAAYALGFLDTVPFALAFGGPGWDSVHWFGVPVLAMSLAYSLYGSLFAELFLVPWLSRLIGPWLGPIGAAVAATICFFPPVFVTPISSLLAIALLANGALVLVFLRWGILASLLARLTASIVPLALLFAPVEDTFLRFQSLLPVAVVLLPLFVAARHLLSRKEFLYRYEDVPAHVRRIAERERQKVELETARRIQSSILPELPPELYGVQMAHTYQPASEVGGDFYDVLALEDGRLAVAVGDVAGHGVSSGLVMSMAKSALAVQVTFDPEVAAVFATLNRMVYQSARRRLLTTLCYALVDPTRREMSYASAGHLFPYRISLGGRVESLESVAYPLGVRNELEIRVRATKLEAGDSLFLFSDGVVEARAEGDDEMFGFDRLEESLARHAEAASASALRDGVLRDIERFTKGGPADDDLTILALRLPA